MSVYQLKSRFQNILRPLVRALAARGVTANQVTTVAAAVSVALGLFLSVVPLPQLFLLVPVWFLLRMGLNAIDGMLAREHGQKSILGAYLNEIGDVVSDAALYLPFALIDPNGLMPAMTVIFLSVLTEFAGVLGQTVGASGVTTGHWERATVRCFSARSASSSRLAVRLRHGLCGFGRSWLSFSYGRSSTVSAPVSARRARPPDRKQSPSAAGSSPAK